MKSNKQLKYRQEYILANTLKWSKFLILINVRKQALTMNLSMELSKLNVKLLVLGQRSKPLRKWC